MTIETRHHPEQGQWVIAVTGNFTFPIVRQFRRAYAQVPAGVDTVIIDLADVRLLDSSALGMLLNMKSLLGDRIEHFRIINCSDHVRNIFDLAHFHHQFAIES